MPLDLDQWIVDQEKAALTELGIASGKLRLLHELRLVLEEEMNAAQNLETVDSRGPGIGEPMDAGRVCCSDSERTMPGELRPSPVGR